MDSKFSAPAICLTCTCRSRIQHFYSTTLFSHRQRWKLITETVMNWFLVWLVLYTHI